MGSSADLSCFDFEGNKVWGYNLEGTYGKIDSKNMFHGLQTSPFLDGDRLYVALMNSDAHWVIALDKATGKEVWKYQRPTDAKGESSQAYATPVIWQAGDKKQLIVLGSDYATGHNLADGSEIWRLGDLNPVKGYSTSFRIIASPLVSEDVAIIGTARDNGPIVAVKAGATGKIGIGSEAERWRAKGAPDVSSPLLVGKEVYLMQSGGFLLCLNATNGQGELQATNHQCDLSRLARLRGRTCLSNGA